MTMGDLRDALEQKHPHWRAMEHRWRRYEAFGGGLDSDKAKRAWLPRGEQEWKEDYDVRVALTHDLGWTAPAITRMVGSLTKTHAERSYTESELPTIVVERLEEFDNNSDGMGGDVDSWFASNTGQALRMGLLLAEVVRPRTGEEVTARDEALPYIQTWAANEAWNWSLDGRGALDWIVLCRDVLVASSPTATAKLQRQWRILTQETGIVYAVDLDDDANSDGEPFVLVPEWRHGVGRVPVAEWYAFEHGRMRGGSYVDGISLGDLRLLQSESDQAMASYIHGSPRMVVKTRRDLDEIAADTSHILKLNPEVGEDAEYLQTDVSGMSVREAIIERTSRQSLNAAGIDPTAVTQGSSGGGRSGVAIAWQFSTAEEPILNCLTDAMDSVDVDIHEIVARVLMPGDSPGPHERIFDGSINRTKKWDLMAAETAVDLADSASVLLDGSSPTWERDARKYIASMVPGNATPEQRAVYADEIDKAAENPPEPPPLPPQFDESGEMLKRNERSERPAMDPVEEV